MIFRYWLSLTAKKVTYEAEMKILLTSVFI